ncbi:hypothetical protein AN958_12699 [Leucoagaricus sp. SymC.cos]|nr:hypothetical protein AN958_12699 [Leucoagaricus sp. SymC.cos]
MTSLFSWTDRVNSCLPCLRRTPSTDSLTNTQRPISNAAGVTPDDSLCGLLVDPDGEIHSLHSNPGIATRAARRRRQKKQQKQGWGITLFGYHLFGRQEPPPIHLASDDEDSDDPLYRGIIAPGPITPTATLHSAATFDSDAAPLDADTINNLSGDSAAAMALAEEVERRVKEEERRLKEERRQRRKERKEMKKMARALAADASTTTEFEGFQGSGGAEWPAIPQPFLQHQYQQGSSQHSTTDIDIIEARVPSPTSILPHLVMEEDDEGADLDGMTYARRRRPPPGSSTKDSHSDSRSRTSTSSSNRGKSQKRKSSRRSKSTLSSNDSTSIASPTSPAFIPPPHVATVISPTTVEQGQGFFDYEDEEPGRDSLPVSAYPHHSKKDSTGFPSTGLGVRPTAGRAAMRGGAFLANARDDEFDGTF